MATEGDRARSTASARTPAQARRIRVQWIGEILLVAAIYLAYEFARGLHQGTASTADHVGRTLLHWEHTLHIDPEKFLTVHLDHVTWLAVIASYFYATMHYIVTPAVLGWLYLRHFRSYGPARTWLAASTMISLVIFYLVPTTPPRLLPNHNYPDVLSDVSRFGWWGGDGSAPRGLGHLTNQLAAMPSMHAGWALWCGVLIYRHASRTWVRALGVAYPLLTTLVVLSTGNHYLLDVVAGVLVMAVGAAVSALAHFGWRRLRRSRIERRRAGADSPGTGRPAVPTAAATSPPVRPSPRPSTGTSAGTSTGTSAGTSAPTSPPAAATPSSR